MTLLSLGDRQFLRFLAVGVLNTLFGYGVFSILVLAHLEPGIALAIATIAGVIFNYFTTGRLVFASSGIGQLPRFVAVYGLTFLVNLLALHRLTGAGLSPLLAQAIMLPIMVILTFVLNKLLVFRRP